MTESVPDSKTKYQFDGVVKEAHKGSQYLVELQFEGKTKDIIAYIAGRMRRHYIKILPGDEVKVDVSPYDLERGRIVYRYNKPTGAQTAKGAPKRQKRVYNKRKKGGKR